MTSEAGGPLRGRGEIVAAIGDDLDQARVVTVIGWAGVGKSHLARHVLELRQGAQRLELAGAAALREHPLGLVSSALPRPPANTLPGELAAWAIDRVGRFDVVLVDDADLVDDLSALVLQQANRHRDVGLVMTVRTGRTLAVPLDQLRTGPNGATYALDRLSRPAARQLATDLCGGREPDSELDEALEQLADGNPLHIRELVLGGLESGHVQLDDGAARLAGPLDESQRITQLIAGRIEQLPRSARLALECCLLAGSLPRSVIDRLDPQGGWQELIERQLLRPDLGDPAWLRAAHPLVETWTRRLDPQRRKHCYTALEAADDDPACRVLWQARSGAALGEATALQAAGSLAWKHGAAAAVDVLGAAPQSEAVRLARCRQRLIQPDEEVAAELERLTGCADQLVRVEAALELSTYRMYVDADVAAARAVLERAAATDMGESERARLDARRASFSVTAGWQPADLDAALRVLDASDTPPAAVYDAAVGAAACLTTQGGLADARLAAQRAEEVIDAAAYTAGYASFLSTAVGTWIEFLGGDNDAARAVARRNLARVPAAQTLAVAGVAGVGAWFELFAGDARGAAESTETSWRQGHHYDVFGFGASERYLATWFNAMLGRHDALSARGELGPSPARGTAGIHIIMWACAHDALELAAGNEATALAALPIPSSPSGAMIMRAAALWTLHPAGHPTADESVAQAATMGDDQPRWLFRELHEEAVARTQRDHAALLRCAYRHASSGRWLWVAPAAAAARDTSDDPAERFQAEGLIRAAHNEVSPLVAPWSLPELSVLTPRQWEIVDQVAAGRSNREVAQVLSIAPRTVETHLSKIFDLTGMRSRHKLTDRLAAPAPE